MARHTFGNLRLAMSRADCRDLKLQGHKSRSVCMPVCIANQICCRCARCQRTVQHVIAIPQPHTAMHRGGVHLLAECHQPSLVNGARKAGSAAATCMIRHTFLRLLCT